MKTLTRYFSASAAALVLSASFFAATATAQDKHEHATPKAVTAQQASLIQIIRDSTARFQDVNVAKAEGYQLQFGCVAGDDFGAMGLHYVNGNLVASGTLDATRPQIVIYEPQPDGTLKLIGVDYLLLADAWNLNHSGPPELMGQFFHLFRS